MSKFNAGLHKDVSKIFDGVAIPKRNEVEPAASQNNNRASTSQSTGRLGSINSEKALKNNVKKKSSSQAVSKIRTKFSGIFNSAGTPRQKAMAILAPILFIVLIWVVGRAFNTAPTKTVKAGTFDLKPIPAAPVKDKWLAPEKYPADLRDPMQYSLEPSATGRRHGYDKIIVRGIVYSDDRPTAIIGSEIVGVGGEIYGTTVTKINVDSVEFKMNDNIWTQTVQK